jgi:hypothetical protein
MPDEKDTQRLRDLEAELAEREEELAEESVDEAERRTHERRSDKAAYLRDKLDEQRRSPDE